MEKDGVLLDYVKWDDGVWIVFAKDKIFSGIEIARIKADEDAVSITHSDEYGVITCTREKFVKRENAYGFLTVDTATNFVKSIVGETSSGGVDGETLTNVVRKVVNAAGRYMFDKELSVCYRTVVNGGFIDLVAVTNIDVTLPENWAALEAIENEWSAK